MKTCIAFDIGEIVPAIGPNMVKNVPYDGLKDFQPIAQIASNQMLLAASPKHPFKTVREVIDYAKQNPDKLSTPHRETARPATSASNCSSCLRASRSCMCRTRAALPDVLTIAEAGVPGYEASTWNGIVAPAAVPKHVVVTLNSAINKALGTSSLRERFAAIGAEPVNTTPEQFAALVRSEHAEWGEVIRRARAKIE